jgi:ketosteroid isomerase-like protein
MKRLLFAFLLTAVFSCANFAQKSDAKISLAIRAVLDEQVAAWNRGDIDSFMKGYWNSPELTFVSGQNITRGWQPTLERYKNVYGSRAKMGVLSFSDLEITVLNKRSAVVLGKWSLEREKDNPHGIFTLTFRRLKEGWRIIMDHTS